MQMMRAIKFEDDLRERLRKENMLATRSTLEKQMKEKKEQ
jgi:hypothetical protein